MPRQNGKNVGQNGKKCTEDRCSTKYRITGDRYIGSLFRVDEPFPMIRRRTVIFLVRVATQSIPKKKAKKNPAGLVALRDGEKQLFSFFTKELIHIPRDFLNDSKLEQSATPAYSPLILSSTASMVSSLA